MALNVGHAKEASLLQYFSCCSSALSHFPLLQLLIDSKLGSQRDLAGCRRVAKSTGASVVTTLADMDGQESFDASSLGQAEEVISQDKCLPQSCSGSVASQLCSSLRGATLQPTALYLY